MRYAQLRAFHYVATCGGFSRAAEELCLTQPAISDQVRKLEEEYDILLFNRQRKQATLTELGKEMLAITRNFFECEQQAKDLLTESRALRTGTLRIVADSAYHLLGIMKSFQTTYPNVRIIMQAGNTETVIRDLYSYDADIGVLGEIPTGQDFEILKLSSTPIIAFASLEHPISQRASLTFADLAELPLVLRERGSKTRRKLEEGATIAGVKLQGIIEAEGREAVREIVAAGIGIGVVSQAEFGHDPRLIQIPIEGPPMLMEEAMICLKERSQSKIVRALFSAANNAR